MNVRCLLSQILNGYKESSIILKRSSTTQLTTNENNLFIKHHQYRNNYCGGIHLFYALPIASTLQRHSDFDKNDQSIYRRKYANEQKLIAIRDLNNGVTVGAIV